MNKELVDQVKSEAVGLFFNAGEHLPRDINFGIQPPADSLLMNYVYPDYNFATWQRFFVPQPLRPYITRNNNSIPRVRRDGLFVFQYQINRNRLTNNLRSFISDEEEFDAQKSPTRPSIFTTSLVRQQISQFNQRFQDLSCVLTNFDTSVILLGEKDLMQLVMDHFKQQPSHAVNFYRELANFRNAQVMDSNNWPATHLFDLLKPPKELHFSSGK